MAVRVDTNHPIFLLKHNVQAASQEFLTAFGFSYFQYLRCFDDGYINCLTNNTTLFEYFQQVENEPLVYSSYEQEHEQNHSYWFFWMRPYLLCQYNWRVKNVKCIMG